MSIRLLVSSFLRKESMFLNGKVLCFSQYFFLWMQAGFFYFSMSRKRNGKNILLLLGLLKWFFHLLLFTGYWVGKATSGFWHLISIQICSKTSTQPNRDQSSPGLNESVLMHFKQDLVPIPLAKGSNCSLRRRNCGFSYIHSLWRQSMYTRTT